MSRIRTSDTKIIDFLKELYTILRSGAKRLPDGQPGLIKKHGLSSNIFSSCYDANIITRQPTGSGIVYRWIAGPPDKSIAFEVWTIYNSKWSNTSARGKKKHRSELRVKLMDAFITHDETAFYKLLSEV